MTAAMRASRLTVPGIVAVLAIAIGIADWPSLVALIVLAVGTCSALWWLNRCHERASAEMRRAVEAILRSRTPDGSAPTPDRRSSQPPSGDRVGVTARSPAAAPAPTPCSNLAPSIAKAWSTQTPVDAVGPRLAASTGLHRRGRS